MLKYITKGFLFLLFFTFIACTKEDSESSVTLNTGQAQEVQPTQYTLTVTAGQGGSVTSGGTYDAGTELTLTATPDPGYEFVGWEGNDAATPELTLTLNSDQTLNALFELLDPNGLLLRSEFANESNANVVTDGIFAIWWDKNFDHEHLSESEFTFSKLQEVKVKALNDLEMFEPPNVEAGYYLNIYIHHENDIFSSYSWGNGVGTNSYGLPYWTTGHGGTVDEANIYHEGFHLFQYNQNSPGFIYSGDSMWYTEATAQWFAFVNQPSLVNSIVEAAALVLNPQLTLWHSFSNRAPEDVVTWLYEVRQYAMHGFLYYLTAIEGVNEDFITSGFSAATDLFPQEYLYQAIGRDDFRTFFANWAAANTSNLSYLTREQVNRAYQEVDLLIEVGITSEEYKNEFAIEIDGNNATGVYSPNEELRPRSWAYNVVKVSNVSGKSFSFSFQGDASGSEGAESFFEARIVKKAGENNYSTTDFELENGLTGTHSVTLNEEEEELYIVIASVPEQFSGFQNFGYSIELVEGTIEQTDQEEPLVESFSIDVTANSSSHYTLIGTDRNGSISGSDPDLLFNVGDTIQFEVNASGHPFYLKTLAGTGTSNTLSGVINNGASNGTVSWTPTTAGTYYYQCALHAGMVGTITVE